ncbi:MAG TPA: PQQ-binding-like beta-propeller repeat protein [Pyrinomonadaceae bacterium]|nr:PQQ-binding-like beta-propeller repeat protein [Pyrinomonadaceae bacterium]
MRSRTIVSVALLTLVTLVLPLIISRHSSQANSPAKAPKLIKSLASDNSVKSSPAQFARPLPNLKGEPASAYLKKHGPYLRLQNLIEAAQYQIDQQPQAQKSSGLRSGLQRNNASEIYEATNPAQKLRARFNGRDVVLQPLTNKRTTRLQARLRLQSYGYARRMLPAGAGTMRVDGNRIEIGRRLATQSNPTNTDPGSPDEIVEWYQNRKDGLEQGFTLAAPPGKRQEGTPLRVRLTVTGEVRPALMDSGKALELIGGNGEHWLRYDHLMATDVTGRKLQAHFRVDRNQISLLIDDTEAAYPLTIDPLFTQTKKLTTSEAAADDRFGYSVATNGDTVVVGATGNSNTGAAYVFERNQGGAENWGQVKKLTASDAAGNDQFGRSVAIDVDTVVVGAWLKNSNTGAAYIFKRNQGGAENWGQVKKLTASDAAGNDLFGSSVSINADTMVVGAFGKVPGSNYISTGAAYIFERNQGGTENWGQVQKLTSDTVSNYAYFGYSVAINGDTVVVGAYGKTPGVAYIFERNQGGAENWGQVKSLIASDAVGGDQFGISVAINNNTLAVGANHGNRATSGAVYIFERNQNGVESWGQTQELTADDAALQDEFGISVAIDGDSLVVGAWALNLQTGGAAYIFERNQNGVTGWVEAQKLTASDVAAHDQFGSSVGIDGDTVVVGAVGKNSNTGSAYTFGLTSTPSPTPTPNASCGFTANLGSPPAPATTGTMSTRLNRGEVQGTCSTNSFPGNSGSGSYPFDAYNFTNSLSSPVCVSVALTVNSQSNANYQIAAFLAPFVATDVSNASRYLGDPGLSSGTPSPVIQSFQFTVPGNTSFAIVVFSVNNTAELGGNYTFQIMSTSSFCPAPTPTATPPTTRGTAVAYQIDAAHTGAQFEFVNPPLTQRWSRDLGGQISYPLIAGGRIFVTVANQSSYGTKLYALDEANGATLWGPVDLGGSYNWSNAAYEAGRVFVVNFDGLLRAFDAASGALLWSKQLPGQSSFWSPPTASGGVVYTAGAGTGTTLYAINEQDGSVNGSVVFDHGNDSSPAVTSTGVFVSYDRLYDFSAQDGSLIWTQRGASATPVVFGGRVYVGDSLTEKLMYDAPTGALLGTFPAGPPPAFSGSTGFFLTGSILKARDAYSGAVRWSFTGDGTLSSAPIVDNGYVYIGSSSGKIYALDASTGANVWTGNIGVAVQTTESPVSRPHTGIGAGDGLVVVPASTLLVAYQGAPATPPILLADESGPSMSQAAALDSVLFTRDPFPVINGADLLNHGVDRNTRVILFVSNLQLAQWEPASSVTVSLTGSDNQTYDLSAEDVRQLPRSNFVQVIFRLPDSLAVGTCTVKIKAHGQVSNSGTIRIKNP